MSPEQRQPITDPDELQQLKTDILNQWRRLPPEAGVAVMVEQLRDLMERGLMTPPETDPVSQPFGVASVRRADMIHHFTNQEIAQFDDEDMEKLAALMGDWYRDESYWHDLETIGRIILEEKDHQPTPDP